MVFVRDFSELEELLEPRRELREIFRSIRVKAGPEAWDIIMSMLHAAWIGEDLVVPTAEHPFFANDGRRNYTNLQVDQEIPDELEPALKMLLDDPVALRELCYALEMHFTLLICPYSGGVMIRGLLFSPGGKD